MFKNLTTLKKTFYFTIFLFVFLASNLAAQSFLPIYKKGYGMFEVDLTIGGDVDDENYIFTSPGKICVDPKGNIFVLDPGESQVKKFDPSGKHLKTFSRAGKGPGEILSCYQMATNPEGHIVTYDLGNRRFSFFTNDGSFLHSIPFQQIVWNFEIGPKGNLFVETHDWDFSGKLGGALIKVTKFSPDLKTSTPVDSARIKDNTFITKPVRTNVPIPFHPGLYWGILPSGNVVVAFSENYTMKIYSPAIKLLHKITHERKREKVTDKDKESYFAGMTSSVGGQVSQGAPDYIRKNVQFPKFKPYFMGIKIDHDGYILARTYETSKENIVCDVFNQEGQFINAVKLAPIGGMNFANGFVYTIKASEDEFPVAVRYRLR